MDIVERLRNAGDDPMWADHCELRKTTAHEAADTIERLRSELEDARRDALRYRWLRDKHPADLGLWVAHGVVGVNLQCWRNEELDAAIDAAQGAAHGE